MNRKVLYARLQTQAYVPQTGDLGAVFPPNNKTLSGLEMSTSDTTLTIKFLFKGIHTELLIPHGNVVVMQLAPEEKPQAKAVVHKAA